MRPLDGEVALAVLAAGQFQPLAGNLWRRDIPEEGTSVTATILGSSLELNISPTISVYAQHEHKRLAASVYFEIAAKYAEKVGGRIVQKSNVFGCKPEGSVVAELELAQYPDAPLMWDKVCAGFQAVLLGE